MALVVVVDLWTISTAQTTTIAQHHLPRIVIVLDPNECSCWAGRRTAIRHRLATRLLFLLITIRERGNRGRWLTCRPYGAGLLGKELERPSPGCQWIVGPWRYWLYKNPIGSMLKKDELQILALDLTRLRSQIAQLLVMHHQHLLEAVVVSGFTTEQLPAIAPSILRLVQRHGAPGDAHQFVVHVIDRRTSSHHPDPSSPTGPLLKNVLRDNSLPVLLLSNYTRSLTGQYLRDTLGPVLRAHLADLALAETDPARTHDVAAGEERVRAVARAVLDALDAATGQVPAAVRDLCAVVHAGVDRAALRAAVLGGDDRKMSSEPERAPSGESSGRGVSRERRRPSSPVTVNTGIDAGINGQPPTAAAAAVSAAARARDARAPSPTRTTAPASVILSRQESGPLVADPSSHSHGSETVTPPNTETTAAWRRNHSGSSVGSMRIGAATITRSMIQSGGSTVFAREESGGTHELPWTALLAVDPATAMSRNSSTASVVGHPPLAIRTDPTAGVIHVSPPTGGGSAPPSPMFVSGLNNGFQPRMASPPPVSGSGAATDDESSDPELSTSAEPMRRRALRRANAVQNRRSTGPGSLAYSVADQVVATFMFLRVIVPAITLPDQYGLLSSTDLSRGVTRGLILVGKLLLSVCSDGDSGAVTKQSSSSSSPVGGAVSGASLQFVQEQRRRVKGWVSVLACRRLT
ncbi:hypothetical protein BC828DRAFT_22824, partial [Blastocladiella britannica]